MKVRAWRGAMLGTTSFAVAFGAFMGPSLHTGLGFIGDVFAGATVSIIITGLIATVIVLLGSLVRLPSRLHIGGIIGAIGFFAVIFVLFFPFDVALGLGVAFVLPATLLGGALGWGIKSRVASALVLFALVYSIAGIIWLANPGTDADLVSNNTIANGVAKPATRGVYVIRTLTYGSGTDTRRVEYGAAATLKTESVDASPFLPHLNGIQTELRRWYWNFDAQHFPINGRVWYPDGAGPFPLVLVAHGQFQMEQASELGYAYLAEFLASRGYVVALVDENFLNRSWSGEMAHDAPARGWILLQHLRVWHTWNEQSGNPFHRKIDVNNLALIGHSRGGEAIAVAALFNQLPHLPENPALKFDFDFNIRTLIALAPREGAYRPGGKPIALENVNYLLVQGAHDADEFVFEGWRQYQRVTFTDARDQFKAAVYLQRANHSRFNTIWGETDFPPPWGWFLNTQPLHSPETQREIARTLVAAFLDATLRGERAAMEMFTTSQKNFLPSDVYVTQFEDPSFRVLADFEEDENLETTTAPTGTIRGENLTEWRESALIFRNGRKPQNNRAVWLRWNAPNAMYAIGVPDVLARELDSKRVLVLNIVNADSSRAIDFTVALVMQNGNVVRMPLSRYGNVPPTLRAKISKLDWLNARLWHESPEYVFQTIELPLKEIDARGLKEVQLRFDQTEAGAILLDRIGFRANNFDGSAQ